MPQTPSLATPGRVGRALAACALLVLSAGVRAEPLSVFVTVPPVQTLVERVGGDRVTVQSMVGAGQDPHTYEPTPRQVAALSAADLYLKIGMPFEAAWMRRITAANPGLSVVDLRAGLPARTLEGHGHGLDGEHDHDHDSDNEGPGAHRDGERDPHIWTNPMLAQRMASAIRAALSRLDPAGAEVYAANQAALDADLAQLDADLTAAFTPLTRRSFLVYHPAWGYLADAYGLTQVPIEQDGKEPGPKALAALIDQARAGDIRLVLVQPQFDQRAAATVAGAIGGEVATVDDLSPDYFGSLRRFAELLVAADRPKAGAP